MSQKTKQNRIYESDKLDILDTIKKEIEPSEIKDRETRYMLIWYLRVDQGKSITDIAILLQCERRTVAESIKRLRKQRALQLEKEGIDLYTEFVRFRQGIELIKDRALAKGDLSTYLSALSMYMNELRRCGFIKANANIPHKFELNVENANVIVGQILELFSAIPTERLKEIGERPTAKHKEADKKTKH